MHLSLLSGRLIQAGPFPSTSDVPLTPKHHSFLASSGIAVVVILVVFPVLLISCLMVCRWRPRQMPIRSGLDAPSPITVIVPPPPIDEHPPLISMDDRSEFYNTRLQRFPLNRQALWHEIMVGRIAFLYRHAFFMVIVASVPRTIDSSGSHRP